MNARIMKALTELWWQDAITFGLSLLIVLVSAIVLNHLEDKRGGRK